MTEAESLLRGELMELSQRVLAEGGPFFDAWMRSQDAVAVHVGGRVVAANTACASLFGVGAPEDLFGRRLAEFVRPEGLGAPCEARDRAQDRRQASVQAVRLLRRSDGTSIAIEESSVPFELAARTLTITTARELKVSSRIERALSRGKTLLREVQRIAKVGSWELDLTSNELTWSDEIFLIFEIDPASFAASYEAFLALVHPDDRTLVNEAYARSVREREPYAVIHRLRMHDGRIKHVQERGETSYDEACQPLRSIGTVQDITTQVTAAETLARERALLQTIVDASPDWIFSKDAEYRFLIVNRAFAASVGRTPAELVGRLDTDFWPQRECEGDPSSGLRGSRDDDRAAMSGEEIHVPREEASDIGGTRVLETFKGPLRDPSGTIVGSYGYARDITEAERAQRALRESERRLALIFNATKDLVALVDVMADGRLVVSALNDAHVQVMRRLSGAVRGAADLIGRERHEMLAGVLTAEEIARGDAMYRRAIATGQPVAYAIEVPRLAGGMHFDATVTPVLDGAGRCTHVLWTARDTTERFRTDAALRSSEARYRAVVEDQTEFVCRFGADGRLTFANDAACRFVGMDREELLRGSFGRFLPEEDRRLGEACRASLTPDHPVASVEHRVRVLDGRVRWTRWVNRGLFDSKGQLTELQSVGQDITEQHASAARIAKQLEERELLLREIHHRVKNNLQVVSSLLFLQRERAESKEAVANLRESSARVSAMALIHEKLYAADDLAGVDMCAYARDLARSLLCTYGFSRDRIALAIQGSAVTLRLDHATPFGLVLNELLTNALKHGFPEGRAGRVQLGFSEAPGHYELTIGDDGIGAPADVLDSPSATLGMRLVSRLILQLGGTIERLAQPGTVYRLRMLKERAR